MIIVATLALTAVAQRAPSPALNPRVYPSPSGKFAWEVDPTDLYGRGDGNYKLTKNGIAVWSGRKPFTLHEAGVTDDGVIAGYAYTHGVDGFSKEGGRNAGEGEFQVIIMTPTGELLLQEKVKRKPSRFLHELPTPVASGLTLDGAGDRLVVRVSDTDLNRRQDS